MSLIADIAEILQTTEKNAKARVLGLKIGDVCGRCGGSGQYSHNQMDGSRCYGCDGKGQIFPRNLAALKTRAKEAALDGRLAVYREQMTANKANKHALDRVMTAWHAVEAVNGYDKIWRDASNPEYVDIVRRNRICVDAYDRVSMGIYGTTGSGVRGQKAANAVELQAIVRQALADIEGVAKELRVQAG